MLALLCLPSVAAGSVSPLPSSDYTVRAVCAKAARGRGGCLALQLVPRTAAARARKHPAWVHAQRAVDGAFAGRGGVWFATTGSAHRLRPPYERVFRADGGARRCVQRSDRRSGSESLRRSSGTRRPTKTSKRPRRARPFLGAGEVSNSWSGPEAGETPELESASPFNHKGIVITAAAGDDGYLDWDAAISAPTVSSVSPASGSVNGGTEIKIIVRPH